MIINNEFFFLCGDCKEILDLEIIDTDLKEEFPCDYCPNAAIILGVDKC